MSDSVPINIGSGNTPSVSLTSAAIEKIAQLLGDQDEGTFFRVGVRPGGCSGFTYERTFDTAFDDEEDERFEFASASGVPVVLVVDHESAAMLSGTTIDFEDNGMDGSRFVFNNPNETRSCGCGLSFS